MSANLRSLTLRQNEPDVPTGRGEHEMRWLSAKLADYDDPVLQCGVITLSAAHIGKRDVAGCCKPLCQQGAFIRCKRSRWKLVHCRLHVKRISRLINEEVRQIEPSATLVSNWFTKCFLSLGWAQSSCHQQPPPATSPPRQRCSPATGGPPCTPNCSTNPTANAPSPLSWDTKDYQRIPVAETEVASFIGDTSHIGNRTDRKPRAFAQAARPGEWPRPDRPPSIVNAPCNPCINPCNPCYSFVP
jgi:hypothetical protein